MKQMAGARPVVVCLALINLCSGAWARSSLLASQKTQDKTITKVVKLLQDMLDKSKVEGDEEREIYAKFKCYCDQNDKEKTESIAAADKSISLLESKIEELQGSTGELSSKCASLKADMAENEEQRKKAASIYKKETDASDATVKDLTQAIGQMKAAIETLTEVGADQTLGSGADHKQFMAGKSSLMGLTASVQKALATAQAFANEHQQATIGSFLQAPFTGTYTSQAGPVMGILKSMRDTFKANLDETISTQTARTKAHNKYMDEKQEAWDEMSKLYDEAQESLGENDGSLSKKRSQLTEVKNQKKSDEEFLEKLTTLCEDKANSYEERKLMRTNEEVALAEAISILNSDASFSTFSTVDATSFVQVRSVQRHLPGVAGGEAEVRAKMEEILRKAAGGKHSRRLSHVVSLLHRTKTNPFTSVLKEIDTMLDNIEEEGKTDLEKKEWCEDERKTNKKSLAEKKEEILMLDGKIDKLTDAIEDPVTGLLKQIADLEDGLKENTASQTTQTAERKEANVAYQKDVKNLVEAEKIIDNAIKVLKAYYDKFDFLQVKEDPNAPDSPDAKDYVGQSAEGKGAIGMLEFILKDTKKEETEAHAAEETAQADYEDSMKSCKDEQEKMEEALVDTKESLADTKKELLDAKEDLKTTTEEKEAIEDYLEKIKPGCDFIQDNFELREKNRGIESAALKKGKTLLKATPAYKSAVEAKHQEDLGKCKDPCNEKGEDHVSCKACLSDVTEPGYCAGHPGTPGC